MKIHHLGALACILSAGAFTTLAADEDSTLVQTSVTLPTSSGTTGTNSAAMTAATVYGLNLNNWKGTWENGSLNGQVAFGEEAVSLQIGAAANGNGNYAGLHFALPGFEVGPASLTFTLTKASQWGGSIDSFDCTYTCTVYGFDSTGTATTLGTWSMAKVEELAQGDAQNISIDLTIPADAEFASFGVVFNSRDTTSLTGGAGMSANIANLTVKYSIVPEPATATLSLLALAGLAARRRRK